MYESAYVSVIIPTYNRKSFITKAIDSVLSQKYTNYEVIVVDDGSTDETRLVLNTYVNKIKYIYQNNAGVSEARNSGIRNARGEWIAFLDSDDEWNEGYLDSQVKRIEEVPCAVAHMTNALTVFRNGEIRNLFSDTKLMELFADKQYLIINNPLKTIIRYQSWFLQSSLIRKDKLFETGMFNPKISIAEDIDVISRIALRGAFTICKKELVKVFRREEELESLSSISFRRGINRYRSFINVYRNILNKYELNMTETLLIKRTLSQNIRALGNVYIKAGKRLEARQSYKESFIVYPTVQSMVKYYATYFSDRISNALVRKANNVLPGEDC